MSKKTSLKGKGVIEFYGFEELIKKLDRSEKEIKKAVEGALKRSAVYPKTDMLNFVSEGQHNVTNQTYESFQDVEVYWEGTKCKGEMGFSIEDGGIAALMLDVGTPKIRPYFFIYYAVNNNMQKIKAEQNKAINEIFKELK